MPEICRIQSSKLDYGLFHSDQAELSVPARDQCIQLSKRHQWK